MAMNDTISRDAAIRALDDKFTVTGDNNAVTVREYIRRVYYRLCDLPSVQPELMNGKWIYHASVDVFECSVCGRQMVRNIFDYCPWCGARMVRGEEDGNI